MKVNAEKIQEINELLEKEDLGFPEHRKTVQSSGGNLNWIRKALTVSGKGSPRLRELFGLV